MTDTPIQDYSAGYYSVELRPMPYAAGPTIDSEVFGYIENNLYANTTAPVWMRAGFEAPYFKLTEKEPMPTDVIGLPADWMEDMDLTDDNRTELFFILKPGHAHFVSQSCLWGSTYDREEDN